MIVVVGLVGRGLFRRVGTEVGASSVLRVEGVPRVRGGEVVVVVRHGRQPVLAGLVALLLEVELLLQLEHLVGLFPLVVEGVVPVAVVRGLGPLDGLVHDGGRRGAGPAVPVVCGRPGAALATVAAPAHKPADPGHALAETRQQRPDEPDGGDRRQHDAHDRDDLARLVVHACVPRLEALGRALDVVGEGPGHEPVDSTHVHGSLGVGTVCFAPTTGQEFGSLFQLTGAFLGYARLRGEVSIAKARGPALS